MLKKMKKHYKTLIFITLLAFAAALVAFSMPAERVWGLHVDCAAIKDEKLLDGSVTITKVDENGAYLAGATVTITKETWTGDNDANGDPVYGSSEVYTKEIPQSGIVLTSRTEGDSNDTLYIPALSFGDINATSNAYPVSDNSCIYITRGNETKRKGRITIEETQAPEGYEGLAKSIVLEYEWEIGPYDDQAGVYSVPDAQGRVVTTDDGRQLFYVNNGEGCDYPLKVKLVSPDNEKVQFSELEGTPNSRENDHFYSIQITNPQETENLVVKKETVDNEKGTFPFTIKAWKEATTLKKIADLTYVRDVGKNIETAQFSSNVDVTGVYEGDGWTLPFDITSGDISLGPNDNDGNSSLLDLGNTLYSDYDWYSVSHWQIDMAIGEDPTIPVHIYLDYASSDQTEYVFGFYVEESAAATPLDSSNDGTSRTIGDSGPWDFSGLGFELVDADEDTYTFSLANGKSKAIPIPLGYKYEVTEGKAKGWELDSVEATGGATKSGDNGASGTMDADNASPKVTFTNKKKTGSLTISKTVAGNAADTAKGFEFTVTLTDVNDAPIVGSTFTGTKTDANNEETSGTYSTDGAGKFTVTLGHKESLAIKGIPVGAKYTVTEDDYSADGYTTSVGGADGRSASGTIDENSPSTASFTNVKDTYGQLVISKAVAGNAADAQKGFSFTVELKTNGAPLANTAVGTDTTDANGKITFTLKHGGSKTITGIPNGTSYVVTEADYTSDGYVTTKSGDTGTIAGGADSSVTAAFTNTRNANGSLTIAKNISGNAASEDDEFTFTITLDDATISNTYSGVEFAGSVATIKLKGGQTKAIEDLPNGVGYTVKETDKAGYVNETDELSGTIDENAPSTASFTNTKNTYGQLVVTKAVAGNAADAQKDFSFTVELKAGEAPLANTELGDDTTDEDGKITFTLKHNGSKTITGIPNGTSYTVTEADYTSDGYVTTKTGDSGTIAGGTDSSVTAAFTNTRNADGSLTIAKKIEGNAASEDDEFTFTITLDDTSISGTYSGVEFKAGVATIKLKGGDAKFIEGLPNGVGYTVNETDKAGYVNDADELSGTIDEDSPSTATFTNVKNIQTPTILTLGDPPVTVQKRVSGDKPSEPETFVFVMAPDDPSYPLQEGAKDGRMEVSIVGEGGIEFGIIAFEEPGIYRYTVYEVAGSMDGYTYDDTVYNVVYTVTEGNDGTLSCDRQILKDDETVNECVFTNNYKETKAPSDPKPEDPPSNPEPEDPPSGPEPEDPRGPEDNPKPEPPSDNPEPEDPSDPEDNPKDDPEDPEDTPSPKPSTPEDNPKDKPSVPKDTPKGKSGGDSPKTGGSAPQTGDSNNLGLFGSILAVSLSVLLLAGYKSRKRND